MIGNTSYLLKWLSAVAFIMSLGMYMRDFNWILPFAMGFVLQNRSRDST